MTEKELDFLIRSYKFHTVAAEQFGESMPTADLAEARRLRADNFAQLLAFQSENAGVIKAQVTALIECLVGTSNDPKLARFAADTCLGHVERLSAKCALECPDNPFSLYAPVVDGGELGKLTPAQTDYLNASADRIAVFDLEYRYVFANSANAKFHGLDAQEFVGRPMWTLTCERFFSEISRPVFDCTLAGKDGTLVAPHPWRDPSVVFSTTFKPIRNGAGRVVGALGVSSPVAALRQGSGEQVA